MAAPFPPGAGPPHIREEPTIKILWHSVAPWAPTGYGAQTGLTAPRIRDLGHDVCLSIYYGHQGSPLTWNGLKCLPGYSANYGTDMLIQHALHHFGAENDPDLSEASTRGLIVMLGDAWTFEVPLLDQMCTAAWVPVDHLTLPDVTRKWFDVMGSVPIAMSRFGQRLLTDAGFHPEYAPHGIDTSVFCPGDRAEARQRTRLPADAFIVGMVANNVGRDGSRKAFTEQIAAFAELRRNHSDAFLVLHTDVDQPIGVRLRPFLERMLPAGSYTYSDQYAYRRGMPPSAVADIYRSLDVLTNCSYGEGFGIPIVEAQATGCPVIVTDATAMPELVGAGWKVGYERVWHDSQGAWTSVPHIAEITDAMADAYNKARDEEFRAEAWAFAQDYDADRTVPTYWKPILERLDGAIDARRRDVTARRVFARPGRRERVREADGWSWLDRGGGTDDWVGYADHENWLWPLLGDLLPDGGVLLDVGAHVGRWSIRLSPRASHVIAVEANPETAATLRRHLAMNDVTNVTVVELAAWDRRARLRLENPDGRHEGGGTRTLATVNGDGSVAANRLDADRAVRRVLNQAGRLDLVKVDVEGADLHVLAGMRGLLERYRPTLLIEDHSIYGYFDRADLEQLLADLGYAFEVGASVPSNYQPGVGILDHSRPADYLVCRFVGVRQATTAQKTAATSTREAHSG